METRKTGTVSPVLILLVGILAVSSASLFIRLAQTQASSLVIAAFRLSLATIVTAPFCIQKFVKEVLPAPRRVKCLLGLSGLFLALHFATWITSLEFTSVASSVVLVATTPLWVAMFSPFFLKEKPTRWAIIGLLVSLTGSVIVGMSSGCNLTGGGLNCIGLNAAFHGRGLLGDLLALAGALLAAGYLMIGRKIRDQVSFSSYIFSVYSSAAIILIFLVLINSQKVTGFGTNIYLAMLALALIPQVIGHSSFNWSLKFLPASYVSIALLGEPIGTVILTMIFLHEPPTPIEITGGVFILAGIFLASRYTKNTNERSQPEVLG